MANGSGGKNKRNESFAQTPWEYANMTMDKWKSLSEVERNKITVNWLKTVPKDQIRDVWSSLMANYGKAGEFRNALKNIALHGGRPWYAEPPDWVQFFSDRSNQYFWDEGHKNVGGEGGTGGEGGGGAPGIGGGALELNPYQKLILETMRWAIGEGKGYYPTLKALTGETIGYLREAIGLARPYKAEQYEAFLRRKGEEAIGSKGYASGFLGTTSRQVAYASNAQEAVARTAEYTQRAGALMSQIAQAIPRVGMTPYAGLQAIMSFARPDIANIPTMIDQFNLEYALRLRALQNQMAIARERLALAKESQQNQWLQFLFGLLSGGYR